MKPANVRSDLHAFVLMRPKQRRAFFATATREQLKSLQDACLNLLKNPVGLNQIDLAKVRKYKEQIRTISNRYEGVKRKRKILSQRGGFLQTLLPLLVTLVSSFIPPQ
jgi:hypothetical protein